VSDPLAALHLALHKAFQTGKDILQALGQIYHPHRIVPSQLRDGRLLDNDSGASCEFSSSRFQRRGVRQSGSGIP
jgi:hypothetical protein